MDVVEFKRIVAHVGQRREYSVLKVGHNGELINHGLFTFVGDVRRGEFPIGDALSDLFMWINDMLIPRPEELNCIRVRQAVPPPPQFALNTIKHALWVLECEEDCLQDTAFMLDGIGLVTCAHVVGRKTQAFQPDSPDRKYPVELVVSHEVLNLAVMQIDVRPESALQPSVVEDVPLMSHIAVCGFPNYRHGDSGVLSPGLVVGHRMVSGVRRLLTNPGVVCGMSGGPAIGGQDEVLGICVTGADMMRNAREVEDQAVIPTSALRLVAGSG